jgi:hypothetical protein
MDLSIEELEAVIDALTMPEEMDESQAEPQA